MRILLSTVPITKEATYAGVAFAASHYPPLGLAYIAALLEKHNHQVSIVGCTTEGIFTYNQFKDKIEDFNPDLIGFTVYTPTYTRAKEIAKSIKTDYPKIKIAFGGPHPTIMPKETLKESDIDYVIIGEGEYTMLDLADNMVLWRINGLGHKENNKIVINPPRSIITNLDELPHPARHLLPYLDKYKDVASRSTKGSVMLVMSSRGCPFNCGFCSQTVGRQWRGHSVDYIFEEIGSNNVAKVDFLDDNFAFDRKRLMEFCAKKIGGDYRFKWNCMMRLDMVDDGIIRLMGHAGCNCIFVGVESGNDAMLNLINKRTTTKLIQEKVAIIKKHGIDCHGSIILGYPTETFETLNETIQFLISLPLDGATINIFTPFPGTALAELAKKHGKVSDDWADYCPHSPHPPFVPDGFTAEELIDYQRWAYKRFYLRPKFILKHLDRMFDINYVKAAFGAIRYFMKKEVK